MKIEDFVNLSDDKYYVIEEELSPLLFSLAREIRKAILQLSQKDFNGKVPCDKLTMHTLLNNIFSTHMRNFKFRTMKIENKLRIIILLLRFLNNDFRKPEDLIFESWKSVKEENRAKTKEKAFTPTATWGM